MSWTAACSLPQPLLAARTQGAQLIASERNLVGLEHTGLCIPTSSQPLQQLDDNAPARCTGPRLRLRAVLLMPQASYAAMISASSLSEIVIVDL